MFNREIAERHLEILGIDSNTCLDNVDELYNERVRAINNVKWGLMSAMNAQHADVKAKERRLEDLERSLEDLERIYDAAWTLSTDHFARHDLFRTFRVQTDVLELGDHAAAQESVFLDHGVPCELSPDYTDRSPWMLMTGPARP